MSRLHNDIYYNLVYGTLPFRLVTHLIYLCDKKISITNRGIYFHYFFLIWTEWVIKLNINENMYKNSTTTTVLNPHITHLFLEPLPYLFSLPAPVLHLIHSINSFYNVLSLGFGSIISLYTFLYLLNITILSRLFPKKETIFEYISSP